jgi:hypothetical protein
MVKEKWYIHPYRQLKYYVLQNGTYHLNEYVAKLSHDVYNAHAGYKGHLKRQNIRRNLKNYAYNLLKYQEINK